MLRRSPTDVVVTSTKRHPGVVRPPPEAMLLALLKVTESGRGGERPEAACARRAPKARLDP